jgi:hypothetical protein
MDSQARQILAKKMDAQFRQNVSHASCGRRKYNTASEL